LGRGEFVSEIGTKIHLFVYVIGKAFSIKRRFLSKADSMAR
jgi:hypothetical protein